MYYNIWYTIMADRIIIFSTAYNKRATSVRKYWTRFGKCGLTRFIPECVCLYIRPAAATVQVWFVCCVYVRKMLLSAYIIPIRNIMFRKIAWKRNVVKANWTRLCIDPQQVSPTTILCENMWARLWYCLLQNGPDQYLLYKYRQKQNSRFRSIDNHCTLSSYGKFIICVYFFILFFYITINICIYIYIHTEYYAYVCICIYIYTYVYR